MKVFLFLFLLTALNSFAQQTATTGAFANSFFDDNKGTRQLKTAEPAGRFVTGLIDDQTGEQVSFVKVTTSTNGSPMDISKVDGVIYRKRGSEYFMRVFSGAVNVRWFGAKGDAKTDDTKAIQKAVDLYNNIYIPEGQYPVSGITISHSSVSLFGDGHLKSRLQALGRQDFVLAVKVPGNVAALIENVHIYDLMFNGGNTSKVGLYTSIVSSLIERVSVSSCTEYGILHYRGYTNTYRDCLVSHCNNAALNIYQEGNLLLFESCLFSDNPGSGIIQYSGSTNIFLKCSIEQNGGYGVLLTYQNDPVTGKAPYVQTQTALITFMSCFFEANGLSDRKKYANITMSGQPDPGYLKVRNIVVKGCHFGLGKGERAIDLATDAEHVTIEDNLFAYNSPGGITPIVIGSFYLNEIKRVNSNVVLRNNYFHSPNNKVEILGAAASFSKNAVAGIFGTLQQTTVAANGLTFNIYKTGKMATVSINGTSKIKMEQNINVGTTGIILSTVEKITLSNYEQNGFLLQTNQLTENNSFRFGCVAGKTFNNVVVTVPTDY